MVFKKGDFAMRLPTKKPTVPDFVLIFVLILSAVIVPVAAGGASSDTATVQTAEKTFKVDLSRDTEFSFSSNGYDFTAAVKDGEIYIVECTCPDKICRSTGAIGKNSGAIVCMPAEMVISCDNGGDADDADFIIP